MPWTGSGRRGGSSSPHRCISLALSPAAEVAVGGRQEGHSSVSAASGNVQAQVEHFTHCVEGGEVRQLCDVWREER